MAAADAGMIFAAFAAFWIVVLCAGPAGACAQDAFLDRRAAPWWLAALSAASSEISALTLLAIPAAAFARGWGLVQVFAASLIGRAIGWWMLPRWRSRGELTVYGAAGSSLGLAARRISAGLFCSGRGLSSALRLAVAAAALSFVCGPSPEWCLAFLAVLAAAAIGYGGLRAAIWTGALQALFVAAAVACAAAYAVGQIPGGAHFVWNLAARSGRLSVFAGGISPFAWLAGLAGGWAAFCADHEICQKFLACRSDRDARKAMAAAAALSASALALLLCLGTCLLGYYGAHPALEIPTRLDYLLPHFSATILPGPLRGLVAAALLLTAADLPLSSLSAVSWSDLGGGGERLGAPARWALAAVWAALLSTAAAWMLDSQSLALWGMRAWPAVSWALLLVVVLGCFRPVAKK
ncbi:MAG: hypothetical protein KGJ45_08150 [Elusimicrobia bacterium]|nr:hypothetical protein [Elusimicrobiota bacterium]